MAPNRSSTRSSPILDLSAEEYRKSQELEQPFYQNRAGLVEEESRVDSAERPFRKTLHGSFRGVDPTKIKSKWQLLEVVSRTIPLNEHGLPYYIYRVDMIDTDVLMKHLIDYIDCGEDTLNGRASLTMAQEILEAASFPLDFSQGLALMSDGKPFWEQLEYETLDAYSAFMAYLELDGIRNIHMMPSDRGYALSMLREMQHCNFWDFRARAFEIYRTINHQQERVNRMMLAEDSHYKMAERYIKKVSQWLDSTELDENNMMPDKAIAMIEKLVKISRVSVGLPANGEAHETFAERRVASPRTMVDRVVDGDARRVDSDEEFQILLEDDQDMIDMAQELIIKRQQKQIGN